MTASKRSIVKRYASAYMSLKSDGVEKRVESLRRIVDLTSNYRQYLMNPAINIEIKYEILKKILPHDLLKTPAFNLVMLLIKNKRFDLINLVYDECLDLLLKTKKRVRVKVFSRYPLTEAQSRYIEEFFKKIFDLHPVLDWHQNNNSIGGFLIRWDGMMIDSRFESRIDQLKKAMLSE